MIGAVEDGASNWTVLPASLPSVLRSFGDSQIASVNSAPNVPTLTTPQVLPFHLAGDAAAGGASADHSSGGKIAASDDEIRVAATSYGVPATMALPSQSASRPNCAPISGVASSTAPPEHLKITHGGVRGPRLELDMRNDSPGAPDGAIRVEISSTLQSEIEECRAGCGVCCASA